MGVTYRGPSHTSCNRAAPNTRAWDPAGYQDDEAKCVYWGRPLSDGTGSLARSAAGNIHGDERCQQQKSMAETVLLGLGYNCRSGASTTVTGLVFLGDVAGVIHAYDAKNGKELRQYTAPEGMIINAPPAIYMAGGKQYVAFNVNLGGKTGTQQVGASSIIAFAL